MSPLSQSVESPPKEPAARRILNAARLLVARGGAAEISMGDVAIAAGVSKALVHYHFHDKNSLLRALVDDVGAAVLTREGSVMASETERHALDDYWEWLASELQLGDLRILVALGEYDSEVVRESSRRISASRRGLAGEHVTSIFSRLGLTPRVHGALIGETVTAFVDGLAIDQGLNPDRNPRPAFDVLWLALLTLAE